MQNSFKKRIFTLKIFMGDASFLLKNVSKIKAAAKNPSLSHAFREKIMSVVTAVNGCVYCSWFHTREASAAGVSQAEIDDLFKLQYDTEADNFELPALVYAQHFAETGRNPDPQDTSAFVKYYGTKTAGEIMLFIRVIFFGNLAGNTYDAFLSRLKGQPAPGSNAVFELFFFLLAFPLMFPTSLIIKKQNRQKKA